MSRKPRKHSVSGIYHVILRGNNQQNLFCDNQDREFFLGRMKKYASELGIGIYTHCLMSNHVHILLGNARETVSKFVQKLANSYVYFFNRKYDRSGHLFQGRFKSEPVENDEYFKTVLRYILQNPEKSKIETMERYRWSGFRELMSALTNCCDETKYVLEIFGNRKNMLDFISQKNSDACMEYKNVDVVSDEKAFRKITEICGVINPFKLMGMDLDSQIIKIRSIKNAGLSVNQISRLTGISRYLIKMA